MKSTPYYNQIFSKIESSQKIFDKFSSIHIQKICPLGVELFHPDERTDGQTNRTNYMVDFGKFAKLSKSNIELNISA